jgi:hypothetical protein
MLNSILAICRAVFLILGRTVQELNLIEMLGV